jgi:anti-sigma regulatory factor (Ser/Thr protein kinase)
MNLPASSTFRREPATVPSARAFVRTSLAGLALDEDAVDRLVLASAEAFNNVIFHAEGDEYSVTVSVAGASCSVAVTDDGSGFYAPSAPPPMPPAHEVGHRGLALMYALVDEVAVHSTPSGTAVVLHQALSANGASAATALG